MGNKYITYVLSVAVLAVVYFCTGVIGQQLGHNSIVTPVWPASGIALAALLLFGRRLWPGIAIGAVLVSIHTNSPFIVLVLVAISNTLVPVLSAWLLNKVRFDWSMARIRDVLALIFIGAIICPLLGAVIGGTSLVIGGEVQANSLVHAMFSWWIGDALGVIVITPVILVWAVQIKKGFKGKRLRLNELFFTEFALVLYSMVIFSKYFEPTLEQSSSAYLVFPPLIWIAIRFGQPGSVLAVFLVSGAAIVTLALGYSTDTPLLYSESMLLVQRFAGIIAVTFLVIAAVMEERYLAERNQRALLKQTILLDRERSHLKKVNQAKDEFIAVASHQLRTPATGIKIHLGILRENFVGELPEQIKQAVESAYLFNERQIRIIDDLLGVAQIDMEKVVLVKEETDLKPLVSQVIKHFDSTLAERQQTINFVHDNDKHITKIDRNKIAMVLENLIDNASKYSESGKNIVVDLHSAGKKQMIEIRDQGVGISKNDLDKLFKKFSRIDNKLSIERGGTGLGLYWVKKVIRLHGGRISVASELGKGTTFRIRL